VPKKGEMGLGRLIPSRERGLFLGGNQQTHEKRCKPGREFKKLRKRLTSSSLTLRGEEGRRWEKSKSSSMLDVWDACGGGLREEANGEGGGESQGGACLVEGKRNNCRNLGKK